MQTLLAGCLIGSIADAFSIWFSRLLAEMSNKSRLKRFDGELRRKK
jgi:hypothetical protein